MKQYVTPKLLIVCSQDVIRTSANWVLADWFDDDWTKSQGGFI